MRTSEEWAHKRRLGRTRAARTARYRVKREILYLLPTSLATSSSPNPSFISVRYSSNRRCTLITFCKHSQSRRVPLASARGRATLMALRISRPLSSYLARVLRFRRRSSTSSSIDATGSLSSRSKKLSYTSRRDRCESLE
jgi:hypothetical protein